MGDVAPELDAELASLLVRHRDQILRRWLGLLVECSTLDELAEQKLSKRIEELDLLLQSGEGGPAGEPLDRPSTGDDLARELERRTALHAATGEPFAVAILSPARLPAANVHPTQTDVRCREWAEAVKLVAVDGELLFDAGGGATAVVLPERDSAAARAGVDRLRIEAWRRLGEKGPLIDAAIAACPDDGNAASELLSVAHDRLSGVAAAGPEPPRPRRLQPPDGGPIRASAPGASITPLPRR